VEVPNLPPDAKMKKLPVDTKLLIKSLETKAGNSFLTVFVANDTRRATVALRPQRLAVEIPADDLQTTTLSEIQVELKHDDLPIRKATVFDL